MNWSIERVINYQQGKLWGYGFSQFGFIDSQGGQYILDYDNHWIGYYIDSNILWTAGPTPLDLGAFHIEVDISKPSFVTSDVDRTLLVVSSGNKKIYKIMPEMKKASLFIDADEFGLKDCQNCVYDFNGNVWINEVTGCRVWQFDQNGRPLETLGNGQPGFQREPVSFNQVKFNWIYDLRRGDDGNIYVLDSKNFAVRMIDIINKEVRLIAGTGEGGYTGDGGDALKATFGCNSDEDGPWSLSLDEKGNIFVGDTQNHVVRMIERSTNLIYTIAGNPDIEPGKRNDPEESDPLKLNLPLICSLDYYNGRLFIPEWAGDLIILAKTRADNSAGKINKEVKR